MLEAVLFTLSSRILATIVLKILINAHLATGTINALNALRGRALHIDPWDL